MNTSSDFSETYDIFTSSDDYATRFFGSTGEWFLRVQEETTKRMIAPYGKCDVLDVGGGHGQSMDLLLRADCRVTVFSSAEGCKERIKSYIDSGDAAFRVGDILSMPFPDKSFDVVICYRMTAHITRLEEYLHELARVARKAVILDYPEIRSINYIAPQMYGIKKRLEPNTRHFRCYHEHDLIRIFREAGFRRSSCFKQYFIPMMLHRVLKRPGLSAAMEKCFRALGLTSLLGSPVILKVERSER
jgi:ubiquinone/menaquinone biosynthesis C-methylase UbiE